MTVRIPMAQSDLTSALLRFVDDAELLPYESKDDRPFACGHFAGHGYGALVGGFYLVVADSISSQVLPTPVQPWLALAAFDHLTATPPAASNPDTARALQRRMRVVELLVRLSMTRALDWQTQLTRERRRPHIVPSSTPTPTAPESFRWSSVLRELVGSTWIEPSTQLAIMTLRWGHPRFLIEWQHDPIPDDFPTMLEQLLSGVAEDNSHVWDTDEALKTLLQQDRKMEQGNAVHAERRHRVVELGLAFQHGRVTTSLLFGIIEVLERFGEAQEKRREAAKKTISTGVSMEFRVTTLRFEHMSSVAGSALEHLGDLVRSSKYLHIEELKLPRLQREEEDRCLQQCLADLTTLAPPRSTTRPLRLACQNGSKSFAVFGSMLRYDTAVREVDVSFIPRDMAAAAAWLAFGVFHADAASYATALCLRMPSRHQYGEPTLQTAICSPHWIEIFKRVLTQAASAEDLAPLDAKTLRSGKRKRKRTNSDDTFTASPLDELPLPRDQRVLVEVRKNTKARAQPLLRSPIVAVVGDTANFKDEVEGEHDEVEGEHDEVEGEHDEDGEESRSPPLRRLEQYQVVRRLRGWLAIAVPGAGAAWIQATAVVSERTTATLAVASEAPIVRLNVTALTWVGGAMPDAFDLRRQHGDALMELLALIGEPLTILQLPENGLQNSHVATILQCCPNLRELNLAHNEITDIGPLVEAYANGSCKITTLNIAQDSDDHARVVQQLSRILELGTNSDTGESKPKCTAIERLALRVTPFDDERIDYYLTDVIPPLQRAMFQSPRLEFARIHCDDLDQGNLANEITRLRHEEFVAKQTAGTTSEELFVNHPLPLRAKLALLSVVRHEALHSSSALGGLDGGVVGLIMQFARTTQMRVVSIAADPPLFH